MYARCGSFPRYCTRAHCRHGASIMAGGPLKDIRVIDMTTTSFAVTTTKATDPGRYDLYVNGRIRGDDGDEVVAARAIPFEVTGGPTNAAQ